MLLTGLTKAITELARAVSRLVESDWFRSSGGLVTKSDLHALGERIMSAISDFAAKQKAFNDRLGSAIDGVVGDVKVLNDKITALQNSAGTVTPEDQALLDDLQKQAEGLTSKAEALDAMTPPAPPS